MSTSYVIKLADHIRFSMWSHTEITCELQNRMWCSHVNIPVCDVHMWTLFPMRCSEKAANSSHRFWWSYMGPYTCMFIYGSHMHVFKSYAWHSYVYTYDHMCTHRIIELNHIWSPYMDRPYMVWTMLEYGFIQTIYEPLYVCSPYLGDQCPTCHYHVDDGVLIVNADSPIKT